MNFRDAMISIRSGEKIQRQGWNGKGMFLFIINGNDWDFVCDTGGEEINDLDTLPFICMKTVDNKLVPWLASQTDILADDWQVVS